MRTRVIESRQPRREPIRKVGDGIQVASFADLDGNVIGVIENPHFRRAAGSP